MNEALKWKLVSGFLLVFVAGGIAGAALGGLYIRHLFFEFHHHSGLIGHRMKEKLRTELNLTPEQVARISPVIDKTAEQLQQVRHDTRRRVREIMTQAHQQMAANLTDEQRQKLQQLEERHRRFRHHRRPHHRRPKASPPPQMSITPAGS